MAADYPFAQSGSGGHGGIANTQAGLMQQTTESVDIADESQLLGVTRAPFTPANDRRRPTTNNRLATTANRPAGDSEIFGNVLHRFGP